MQETWVGSLDWDDPLEKGMATHSSVLARRIPRTEEPCGPHSPWDHGESDRTGQLSLSHAFVRWICPCCICRCMALLEGQQDSVFSCWWNGFPLSQSSRADARFLLCEYFWNCSSCCFWFKVASTPRPPLNSILRLSWSFLSCLL